MVAMVDDVFNAQARELNREKLFLFLSSSQALATPPLLTFVSKEES